MDNAETNCNLFSKLMEHIHWFCGCAAQIDVRAKEEGYSKSREKQYQKLYTTLFAGKNDYPDCSTFLKKMKDNFDVNSFEQLMDYDEWNLAKLWLEKQSFDALLKGNGNQTKEQQRLISEETSLERLFKKAKREKPYWESALYFNSTQCYFGNPKSKERIVVDLPARFGRASDDEKRDDPGVDIGAKIYNPLKKILKEIDNVEGKKTDNGKRLLELFTTGPSQKEYLCFNVFGEEAYYTLKSYFSQWSPAGDAYMTIKNSSDEELLLKVLDDQKELTDKNIKKNEEIFLEKVERLEKIWLQNVYKRKVKDTRSGYEYIETVMILQSLLPLIDQEGKAKSWNQYQQEKDRIEELVMTYKEEKETEQAVQIPTYGFSDFVYQEYPDEMRRAIRLLGKNEKALKALQECMTGWENRNFERLQSFVRRYAEQVENSQNLPKEPEEWLEMAIECLDSGLRGELRRSFTNRMW